MGVGRETSPQNVGKFLVWVFLALVTVLVIFAAIFYSQGHKTDMMKNSQVQALQLQGRA